MTEIEKLNIILTELYNKNEIFQNTTISKIPFSQDEFNQLVDIMIKRDHATRNSLDLKNGRATTIETVIRITKEGRIFYESGKYKSDKENRWTKATKILTPIGILATILLGILNFYDKQTMKELKLENKELRDSLFKGRLLSISDSVTIPMSTTTDIHSDTTKYDNRK